MIDRFLTWRSRNGEVNARRFREHPWRQGVTWAPFVGIAMFLAVGVGSSDFAFGAVIGAISACAYPLIYRFALGPYFVRETDTDADD